MTPQVVVERYLTADRLNAIVNDPSIYPWVRGNYEGVLDFTPLVADPNNLLVMGEHGGVFFIQGLQGLYEAHTQILPAGRGKWAVECVRACLTYLFTRTNAVEAVTRVPHGNIAAKALVRSIAGVVREFTNQNGWVRDNKSIPADIYALRIQDWMRLASDMDDIGMSFHWEVEAQYKRLGIKEPLHPDDDVHDRYVGATFEMIRHGQVGKGIAFYNRWAGLAGYHPISLISENPVAVDCGSMIVISRGDEKFMVMPCQLH